MSESLSTSNAEEPQNQTHDPLRLLQYVPGSAQRILDFGCRDGARGKALKERGVQEVVGIETENIQDAAASYDQFLAGDLDGMTFPFDAGRFDCIICDGALPRLRDPAPVLDRIVEALAPGGLLIASAPNIQHYKTFLMLVEGSWTYQESGTMARDHIRFFTTYEIQRLLQGRPFSTTRIAALSADPPQAFPKNEEGGVTAGRIVLAPLSDDEHRRFLIKEFLILANKSDANPS